MADNIIGQTVKRRRKLNDSHDEITITGRVADVFIGAPALVFGPPFTISGAELAQQYAVKAAELAPAESEEQLARRLDAKANTEAAPGLFRSLRKGARTAEPPKPHPQSPEGQFAAEAEAEDGD